MSVEDDGLTFFQVIGNYKKLLFKLKNIFKSRDLLDRLPWIILWAAIAYYIAAFSAALIFAHGCFSTGAHDVGVYDQLIWLISRFSLPISTLGGDNLFAIHTSFYCFLLAPLFWLWSNVNMLYIAQSVFLALTAVPIFLYARKKLAHPFGALMVALLFLLYPALHGMNMENFHPEVLIVFPPACALYFLLQKKHR